MVSNFFAVASVGVLGSIPLTAFSYVNMLRPLSTSVSSGLGRASSTISGYYYGDKDYESVKPTIYKAIKSGMLSSFILSIVMAGASIGFAHLFTDDQNIINMTFMLAALSIP
jgi:Na+-driven multidrug efflux pump